MKASKIYFIAGCVADLASVRSARVRVTGYSGLPDAELFESGDFGSAFIDMSLLEAARENVGRTEGAEAAEAVSGSACQGVT